MRHLARAALLALCLAAPIGAASADDTWEKIVPTLKRGEITHLELLPGGDLLLAGNAALSTPSMIGGWIARFTSEGEEVWSEEFLGGAYTHGTALLVDSDHVYFSGTDMDQSRANAHSSVIAALTLDGAIVWETWVSEAGAGIAASDLQKLENGDFLVKSIKVKKGGPPTTAHYTRLSPSGEVKWTYEGQRTGQYYEDLPPLESGVRTALGLANHMELPAQVIEQPNGALHLYVYRSEILAYNKVIGRCEAVTENGRAVDGKECPKPDQVTKLQENNVAPYLITRFGPGVVFAREVTVEKPGASGWIWTYESDHRAGLTDAVLTPDGGLIGVGYVITRSPDSMHGYDAVIFRLAADGTELWSHEYASPGRDIFARIVALGSDRYAVAGHTGVNSSTGEWNPWLLVIDGDGKTQSAVPQN